MGRTATAENKEILLAQKLRAVDTWYWLKHEKLSLGGMMYEQEGHEYQVDWLQCDHPNQCFKKAAQIAGTTTMILKTLHGHIFGRYKQGTLYLFPTTRDVTDFSKGRFKPMIDDNPQISAHVQDTDAANIKRVGKAMLYFRGARATQKIEGMKSTSSALKSVPVDRLVFDEKDEMDPAMVTLALERISHSDIAEVVVVSTPSIPDYGVDRDYSASDQRIWLIKCKSCGRDTCLELQFLEDPYSCLMETKEGVKKVCPKCRKEIFTCGGRWVSQYPNNTELVGWWISQLNSKYVDPGKILQLYQNPPDGNITEVYNSKLGMAHIAAENRLTKADVFACCRNEGMAMHSEITCAMGVDVGKDLHFVIGYPDGKKKNLLRVGTVKDFGDLGDIARRYSVKSIVVDMEPETRKAREFQEGFGERVYLCDYQEKLRAGRTEDEQRGLVTVRRTEICDRTHELVKSGVFTIPSRCPEIDEFAHQMTNMAKVLEEDEISGSRIFTYKKLGPDHYRHAVNYFELACEAPGLGITSNKVVRALEALANKRENFDPFADM